MKNEAEDCYLDLKRLAAYSSLSVATLRQYINAADNPLPYYCIKRKVLVKKSDFDKWIEGHRHQRIDIDLKAMVNDIMRKLDLPTAKRGCKKRPKSDTGGA
jgi:hypothetical protein